MSTTAEASLGMLTAERANDTERGGLDKKFQGKCLLLVSPMTVYCCFLIITVLLASVILLSVFLSMRKTQTVIESPLFASCPKDWIGFGKKCFYFSEDTRNWTSSQSFCASLEASLVQFESMEELNFLKRYKGFSDHWIGLSRESPQQAWKWTDGAEYHAQFAIRGAGECAYLNDNGLSSARVYTERKWICSKPSSYASHCQIASTSL